MRKKYLVLAITLLGIFSGTSIAAYASEMADNIQVEWAEESVSGNSVGAGIDAEAAGEERDLNTDFAGDLNTVSSTASGAASDVASAVAEAADAEIALTAERSGVCVPYEGANIPWRFRQGF